MALLKQTGVILIIIRFSFYVLGFDDNCNYFHLFSQNKREHHFVKTKL